MTARLTRTAFATAAVLALAAGGVAVAGSGGGEPAARASRPSRRRSAEGRQAQHRANATDEDTGFQGFIDGEGWRRLDVRGPGGQVLRFEGRGTLAKLGLTELFFETVEPENAKVPIDICSRSCRRVTTRSPARHRRTA